MNLIKRYGAVVAVDDGLDDGVGVGVGVGVGTITGQV